MPIKIKGDPRKSAGFIKHTIIHEYGPSCTASYKPSTETCYYGLEDYVEDHLDGWLEGDPRSVGNTIWETKIHPTTGEKCYIVNSSTDDGLIYDLVLRDVVRALFRWGEMFGKGEEVSETSEQSAFPADEATS